MLQQTLINQYGADYPTLEAIRTTRPKEEENKGVYFSDGTILDCTPWQLYEYLRPGIEDAKAGRTKSVRSAHNEIDKYMLQLKEKYGL